MQNLIQSRAFSVIHLISAASVFKRSSSDMRCSIRFNVRMLCRRSNVTGSRPPALSLFVEAAVKHE